MLGGNCSPCCGWKCYYTEDTIAPVKPTGVTAAAPECENETAVTVRLQWDAPVPGDCIPEMRYDVDIASASSGPWQPAKLVNGGTAYGIERANVITNNVTLKCEYDVLFTEAAQVAHYRANNAPLIRRVYFRVRSDVHSGPYNGQTSDWTTYGPINDPRYCGNNYSEVYVSATPTYFEVPLIINHSGYSPEGCATPNASVNAYAITSTTSTTLPNPAVKQGMYFNDTSHVTLGLPLNPDGTAIEGTGLLTYDENVISLWVMVQMATAPEVLNIVKMGL